MERHFTLDQVETKAFGAASLVPLIELSFNESIFDLFSVLYNVSPEVRQYMPGMNFSTPQKVKEDLAKHCLSTEIGLQLSYAMCLESKPFGLVFVNTPTYNDTMINFPYWTIDFCVFVPFAGNGFMSAFLPQILNLLKTTFHIDELFAIVDKRNIKSMSLLSKFWFEEWDDNSGRIFTDPSSGNVAKVLCCNLSTINLR